MTADEVDALAGPWIEQDDNREQWRRLVDAVELTSGFALFVVIVPSPEIGGAVTNSLGVLARALRRTHVDASVVPGTEPAVRRLLGAPREPCLAVMDTIDGWRRPSFDQLRIALMQLNQRRDVVAGRLDGPLFLIVDDEGRQALIEVAPDLWSIRVSEFRFRSGHELDLDTALGRWLSNDELAGMLGLVPEFGEPMTSAMASLELPIPEPVELVGRERELADLRELSLGHHRIVVLEGLWGSGRRSLAARFVADHGERWDRVIWLDAMGETRVAAGIHSVLLALRPDVPPPRTERDLLAGYSRETARQRALIVVCNAELDWPEPRGESFAILTGRHSSAVTLDLRGLRPEPIAVLWRRLTSEPMPEMLARAKWALPGEVVLLARAPGRLGPVLELDSWQQAAHLNVGQALSEESKARYWELCRVSTIPGGIPRGYLSEEILEVLPELLEVGAVVERGDKIEVTVNPLSRRVGNSALQLVLEHQGRLLGNRDGEFERRVLRSAREGASERASFYSRWPAELSSLIEPIAAVLLPCERAQWLALAAGQHSSASAIELLFEALRYDLGCRALSILHARLHRLRELIQALGEPTFDRLFARAAFEVGLQLGDRRQIERSLAIDPNLDRARVDRFIRIGSASDPVVEQSDDLQTALAVTLYAGVLDPELFRRAVDPAQPLPVRHFGHVGLALISIARHAGADSLAALDGVRLTAEQWGAPLPLLRADLLEAEADLAAGRPAAALTKLDALGERLDAYLGRHASEVIRVLMQRMNLASRLGSADQALTLADECWTRAREVDRVAPAVYEALARVYLQHGNPDRAKLAARRWQAAYQDDPAEVQRAAELEREAIEARHQSELADLERRNRAKG